MALTRRCFLKRGLSAGGALAAAGVLKGCAPDLSPAAMATVGSPVAGKLSIEVAKYPDLAKDGGAIGITATGLSAPLLLVHTSGTQFAALDYICPHAGCPLGFTGGEVVCPCHLSKFDLSGKVLAPPATSNLKTYPTHFDATSGDVLIDLASGDANMPPYVDGKVVFPLAQYPQLASPGGSIVGAPAGLGRPIVVAAANGGSYVALDATCTHLACLVEFDAQNQRIDCPCHNSYFDLTGKVLGGPAPRPLASYAVVADATAVTVTIPA